MRANHNIRREVRYRILNDTGGVSPLFGPWDRTVCFSDIDKWMLCPGGYLMWKEGDAIYRRSLSEEIGAMVHQETAKPVAQRMQNVAEIAARLKNVRPEERQAIALEVKKLITKAVRVSDKESVEAAITEHESLMVYYDSRTNTFWYAQPDKMEVTNNGRGDYLLVVDQKTGKWRKKSDYSRAFFFGYVAKMTRALDFSGPIRSLVRYLRDFQGNILKVPEEKDMWIGRRLNNEQSDTLYGIEETIRRMDADWEAKSFPLRSGDHCKGCQFRHSCPINRERFEAQQKAEAERLQQLNRDAAPITLTEVATVVPAPQAPWLPTFSANEERISEVA